MRSSSAKTPPPDDQFDQRMLLSVLTAMKAGDFSVRLPGHWSGIGGKIADVLNDILAREEHLATDFARVAIAVGKEGRINERVAVGSASGGWANKINSVNSLVDDLVQPTVEMARVIGSVAKGDLTQAMSLEVSGRELKGEFARTARVVNGMVSQLSAFSSEVTRVAREVGTEGKLGGQAKVKDLAGTWRDLTEGVNLMASNLTGQVRNIADVTVSVANGDLSKKITVDVRGEFLQLKDTINTMVDQLRGFASEVTRVAREVGTEGKLGGQAVVPGVAGVWKDLTDNVNGMAANLTTQVRNLADVTTAVAKGDLTRKVTVDVKGEILELKNTVNTMVDQLNSFAAEVTRVAREVGTDGKLGGQAEVRGVAGTWRDLTENVNQMAANLTGQVRNIAAVTTAVASGDLSKKITVDAKGEILELKDTINTMVDQLNSFAGEVTRVAREVGTDGKLGGQADVKGVAGTWRDLTENVNSMAENLTNQVRNIAQVTTAVANGDLSKKITVDAKGEILELKDTINTMVGQLNAFAGEVTRVAREVGTDGKLGGQANVTGVAGTWKDLTDNVNGMAANLTSQVRNIADVTTAVANGDLARKITVDAKGEILELKDTINTMVDQLNSFASEVTRVAREVGTDGKLGGQADVKGVAGTWKDLTENVNQMAANLTSQVRNIAAVTTAVADGDLSKKITVDAKGEILELKSTINTMVDQLNSFAGEVTRVAREVGTDGKLGGQAKVTGVGGTWKDLTENVNGMAANLTSQVRNIADVTTAVANGNLSRKITVDAKGEILELKDTINTMVDQLNSFAGEVTRVAREVGTDGKLGGQANVKGVGGTWKDLTDNVNLMAANLTSQVRNIAQVTTAVADGDLSKKITVDAKGEILELKSTINTMVDQLNAFAGEVTRVAREVGTDGKLGGQAKVIGVAGTWKDLTDNVNGMAANLTDQVRGIARVVSAVASGNLKLKLAVDAKGEVAALADTINGMIETLATFADQVTGVAREVGVEGRLGGQANVPGAAGTWKDLTENVNRLAANLTTQVRAIADVSTAVTKGDLSRSITVEAAGEVALLKDNINEMIRNLKVTTNKNTEQDWLKTNLAAFTRKLQGQRDLQNVCKMTLSELAPLIGAQHGVFYVSEVQQDDVVLNLLASYAYRERKHLANVFRPGQGLIGQVLLEKERIVVADVPDDYVQIGSGLGEGKPLNLAILPVIFEGSVKAVIELASFQRFSEIHLTFLDQLMESLGIVVNTIQTNMRTEELLKQSQSLAEELQSGQAELQDKNSRLEEQAKSLQASEELLKKQQTELQVTNEELEEKALELEEQGKKVEFKNRELELTQASLADRAEQLAITSRYKSEFLANMSHELRTPLNSLLLLSRILTENRDGNLTPKQVEQIETIYTGGNDLLNLINEILDLSKIEAGKMDVVPTDVELGEVAAVAERTFRQSAEQKRLEYTIKVDPALPATLRTDRQRLEQVLRNLLSNAFKFTERGRVDFEIRTATPEEHFELESLREARSVIAFEVKDTGIGVPPDRQRIIWEAFQQADGTTSRKYGGTGLGLTISREIANLLGGEIHLVSEEGQGSTFTLYLAADGQTPMTRSDSPAQRPARPPGLSAPQQTTSAGEAPGPAAAGAAEEAPAQVPVTDDRYEIRPGDRTVLIVEDDPKFAAVLKDLVREHRFKVLLGVRGEDGLSLAHEFRPNAILLDLMLPGMDGWGVIAKLKAHPDLRHIPVQIISALQERRRGLQAGALDYLTKPVSKEALDEALHRIESLLGGKGRQLLLVEDNPDEREEIIRVIGNGDVITTAVGTGKEALAALRGHKFDCMILDLGLPDLSGFEVLEKMRTELGLEELPVIIYTSKDLTEAEAQRLSEHVHTVVVKGQLGLPRLLDETALFLHRVSATLPPDKQGIIRQLHDFDTVLSGKQVLIVDDDMRNIYALTSALETNQMKVLHAEDGERGLKVLHAHPDVDVVLMDIMMPVKDGYETIREIRKEERFKALPVLALTAKAMKGDREKCIAAGASDYISKPINLDRLISLLKVWLYK